MTRYLKLNYYKTYIRALILVVILSIPTPARPEPRILEPLAVGGAPPCPNHIGSRTFRSSVVQAGEASASIVGTARRDPTGCNRAASLSIEKHGREMSYALPNAAQQTFDIIDFLPRHSQLLISSEITRKEPDELLRYVELSALLIDTGEMQWHNVWDLLGWKDCDATVYPQGFSAIGGLVLLAKPSVMSRLRRGNCVTAPTVFEYNSQTQKLVQMAADATIERYGKVSVSPSQSCKSDPDLVGACFTVRGRLSAWNGSPTWRISLPGSKHLLGVTSTYLPGSVGEILPNPVGKVDWDVETYANFEVCPFSRPKPGTMQFVCIESATGVTHKARH